MLLLYDMAWEKGAPERLYKLLPATSVVVKTYGRSGMFLFCLYAFANPGSMNFLA